jgi:hypothetical protein
MSIKEQVIEILKKNYITFGNPNDSYTFFRAIDEDVIDKIQAIPDEVTLREVKEQTINKVLEKIQDAGNYNNDTIWYNNYTTLYEEIEHLPDEPCERCKELEKQLKDKDDIGVIAYMSAQADCNARIRELEGLLGEISEKMYSLLGCLIVFEKHSYVPEHIEIAKNLIEKIKAAVGV